MRRNSGELTIYKKLGAAQFKIIPLRENDKGYVEKEGAILLEAAPGIPSGSDLAWDWSRKISFALQMADIIGLFENIEQPKKLLHEQNGSTKTLEFQAGEGKYAGTYMLKLFTKSQDGTTNSVTVPLSGGEYLVLTRMMLAMAPHLIGWL